MSSLTSLWFSFVTPSVNGGQAGHTERISRPYTSSGQEVYNKSVLHATVFKPVQILELHHQDDFGT